MNKVYKVIWSEVSETFVAVPEVVRGASKSSSASPHAPHKTVRPGHAHFFIKSLVAALICIGFTFAIHAAPLSAQLAPASANQLPTGAQVSAGSATVSQSGSVLTLKQTTPKAAVNWQTFNVGAQAQVDIVQPSSSSVLLNRVLDSNPSQIFGKINANGQVFLENPNGVYFAPSASVDTGSFLATTSNISDADFMAGNYRFDRNGATGTIVNQGKITSTLGGYIALLAPEVRNAGVVVARGGTIVLAAGETYQLQFESNNTLTNILVSPSTVAAYIENGNAVQAPGGLIILSAQAANAIQGGVIKNTGSITADVLINDGGVIRLVASSSINHSGTISADASPSGSGNGGQISLVADLANPQSQTLVAGSISAKGGGQGGRGGFIETSGSFVHVDDQAQINTSAPRGTGGSWLLDPTDYTVGTGGDITGATLGSQLNTTSVTISSSGGATGSGGNIFVNDAVTWTGANRLTLSAANNISIANNINVPTGGSVSLVYGSSTASGSYNFGAFSADRTSFTGAINFAGTGAGLFTTQLGSNTPISYTVIQNPSSSTGGVVNSAGNYALGQNYSFSSSFASSPITGTFSGNFDGLGHTVSNLVGTGASGLFNVSSGTLQNVGVAVSIVSSSSTIGGLANANTGTISNSFSTGSITGSAILGGLVGLNSSSDNSKPSSVVNSFSSVSVNGSAGPIGGLIGQNSATGAANVTGGSSTVSNSFATGSVTLGSGQKAGGLIGWNHASGVNSVATVNNSFATGNVTGTTTNTGSSYFLGGLIGLNVIDGNGTGADASINNSHATGNLNVAASGVGGLVGQNQVYKDNATANFLNDYATGAINTYTSTTTYSQSVGGLVGGNIANSPGSSATTSSSHATGSVNGSTNSGGLIGSNIAQNGANASVSNSYATGSVQSNSYNAGGLIGSNYASNYNSSSQYDSTTATVSSSYATGNVSVVDGITASTNQSSWGGLIGLNQSTPYNHRDTSVSNSYATGSVSAMGNNLGGLIGNNQSSGKSTVTNSYATGAVTSSGSGNVGGLIGLNQSNYASDTSSGGNVNVSGSYASGVTTGVNYVGGLIGYNSIGANSGTGIIDASYANANVNATSYVGGLVGGNLSGGSSSNANITNSYVVAGVTVLGANTVGGLVGSNSATNTNSSATLANSYSNATVSANGSNVGGLVGSNTASAVGSNSNISQSYATGNVTSTNAKAGGLAGQLGASNTASSNVDQSFATGSVQSAGYAGGLIGYVITDTAVSITNSFSAGNVVATSGSYFGGFIGGLQSSLASVNNSYAAGSVTGAGQQMGGFLGNFPSGASISNNYWNTTVNPTLSTSGVNGVALNNAAIKGLSTAQMQTLSSFNGFASPTWGAVSFYNNQYPYLSTTTPLAQITLANGGNMYGTSPTLNYTFADASGAALDASGATGSPFWTLSANGSVVATQRLTNTTNAGNYSVTYAGGLSLGRYTLMSPTPATWSVQKVPLGISIAGNYSGTTTINPTSYTLTGLVNSETLAPATVVIADPNVTTANNYVTSIVAKTGTANVNNYQITPSYNATSGTSTTNTASVNGLVLRVSEVPSVSGNYYNGSAYTGTYTINATQASDLALITVTGMPTGVTPGTYPSNLVVTLTGSALSNYVTPVVTNANLVISSKIISIVNSPLVTTYDRATQYSQLASNTLYTSTAMVGSDTLASITQTASVSGLAQAGTYTVTPSAAQMGSGVASNYQFSYVSSLNTVRPLGITASSIASASSAYGAVVTPGAVSLSGVLAGDTVTSTAAISNPTYSTSNHLKAASYFQTAASTSLSGTDAGNYSLTAFTTSTPNYTVTPIAVNGTIAAAASTYGAALAPGAVSLTGKLVGDVVTSTASLVSPAMSASNNVKVGSYNQTATTLSGNDAGNYTLAGTTTSNLNYQVNPLAITVSSISNASSVYGFALSPGVVNLSGVQGVDAVSGSASVINLLYSSSNNVKAGTYPQRASSLLTGNDAANYSLSAYTTPSSNYTVSALPITVGSIAPAASNYGATVAPGAVTLNGVLGSDLVSSAASIVSASYSTSAHLKAGSYNQGASTLTNTDAANYTLTAYTSPTATYTVNALALSANIAAATSSYGATVTPGSVSLGGVLALDVVSASATIANPQNSASAHLKAGSYNQTATTLSGGDAANYTLAATTTNLNYVVSPLTISVASIASATSVYGAQVLTGAVNLSGVVGSDAVLSSASIVSPAYSSSNHLKAAAYNQMASTVLSGNDAVNYTLTPYTTPVANYTVTPLGITASIASANSVYGSALTPGEVTLSGKLTGDVVQSMASVVNPNLSAALQLKAGSYNQSATTLSGVDASNYSLTAYTTNNLNYVVTPLALTASIADATSVYGSAVTPGAVTMLGVIAGDQVSSTASVATPLTSTSNRMSAGTYTQTASVLSGNDASNYSFAPYTTPVANYTVTPLGITALSIDPAQSNYGATVSTGAVTLLGVLAGDVASSTAAIFAPALSSSNHLNAGSFKQTATTLNGADAANYSLTPFTTPTPNYTVTALPLTAAIASATSNYGSASNAGVVTFTGGLTGDVFTSVVALVNPAYSTSNHLKVGSYNQAVNTLTGIDSGNYTLSAYTTTTPNYVVTPLALSGSIAGVNVNYGSALTPGLVTLTGGLSGDSLSSTASLVAAVYSSSGRLTVGSYQQTASVLGGSDASNYTFSGVTTPSANYVVAPISVNASVAAVSLNYGLANAPGGVSLTGVLSGDAVQSVAQIANTVNSSSGRLRVGNYSQTLGPLSGTDARNYTLSNGGASFDNYSVKPLAITVASIAPATSIYASSTTPGSVALTGVLGADQVASQASIVNPLLSSSKNLAAGAYNQAASLLSGSDAGNYSLSAFTTASPNYTVKPLSITASIAPSTSVYGATLVPGAVALGGVIKGDEVASLATLVSPMYSSSLHLAVGNYAQSASTLSGADANNYSLAAFTTPSASYTVSPLMISASVSPVLTTYADAVSTGWVALTGALMGDGVAGVSSLQNPTFSSSQHLNAGSYVQNMALGGLDAKNYSLASTQTPTANYTVAPLSLMGAISPSSSVSGSPLSPGVAQLSNVLPGDRVGDVKVVVNMAAAGAASNTGSPVATTVGTTVGTFVGAQGVSALSGPDAANYSWANVKGDYTVKAGFSAATVYPQESLTSTSQVTPMLKALDATSALALKNSPAGSDNTPPSNSSSNASTVANQSQRALSVPSKGEDTVVASNTVPNAAGADNAAKAGPNTLLAASPLQRSSPAPIASTVAAPTSLASANSKIDVPQTRYFVPGKPGTPAPSSNLFQSAQANELPSTSAFSSPSSNARLDANPSFSLQNKTVPDSSELSGVTALAQTAQGTLESMGQVVGGIALAIPAVGEAISTLVAAAPVVGDVIHGMAVAVPVVAEAVTTLSTTLTFLSAASSAPIVPVPAPSPGVPINSMGMRLPVRWGVEG